jgi:hypothetical protein
MPHPIIKDNQFYQILALHKHFIQLKEFLIQLLELKLTLN